MRYRRSASIHASCSMLRAAHVRVCTLAAECDASLSRGADRCVEDYARRAFGAEQLHGAEERHAGSLRIGCGFDEICPREPDA